MPGVLRFTGNPPYSISPYSAVKRYSGKGDTTLHDAPPLQSAGRISSGAARRALNKAVLGLVVGTGNGAVIGVLSVGKRGSRP